jgi:hypothetical protein
VLGPPEDAGYIVSSAADSRIVTSVCKKRIVRYYAYFEQSMVAEDGRISDQPRCGECALSSLTLLWRSLCMALQCTRHSYDISNIPKFAGFMR